MPDQPTSSETNGPLNQQYATFFVDELFFGVEVLKVQEVLRYQVEGEVGNRLAALALLLALPPRQGCLAGAHGCCTTGRGSRRPAWCVRLPWLGLRGSVLLKGEYLRSCLGLGSCVLSQTASRDPYCMCRASFIPTKIHL